MTMPTPASATLRRRAAAALLLLSLIAAACVPGAATDPYAAAGPPAPEGEGAPAAPREGTTLPDADAPGAAAAEVFRVAEGQSQATFRVRQQLVGVQLPEDVVGVTGAVSGQLAFQPDGTLLTGASKIAVDLRELQTGIAQRDGYIQTNTLATGRFPTAEFAPVQAAGLPAPLPAAGEHRFTLTGPMTLHGVQKEVTWDVTATRQESTVAGLARTSITFADFGLTAPRLPFLHSVAEEIALEVSVAAVAAPPPTGSAQMPAPMP